MALACFADCSTNARTVIAVFNAIAAGTAGPAASLVLANSIPARCRPSGLLLRFLTLSSSAHGIYLRVANCPAQISPAGNPYVDQLQAGALRQHTCQSPRSSLLPAHEFKLTSLRRHPSAAHPPISPPCSTSCLTSASASLMRSSSRSQMGRGPRGSFWCSQLVASMLRRTARVRRRPWAST